MAPGLLPAFDAERSQALKAARHGVSAAPMRRFCGQWAVTVAVQRHPRRAARLRELEERVAGTTDVAEARAIAAELGRILDAAFAEAT